MEWGERRLGFALFLPLARGAGYTFDQRFEVGVLERSCYSLLVVDLLVDYRLYVRVRVCGG